MVDFSFVPRGPRSSPGTKYGLGDSDEVVLGFLMMMAVIIGTVPWRHERRQERRQCRGNAEAMLAYLVVNGGLTYLYIPM